MIDRAIGIVDVEVDCESTGVDLLHDLLDIAGEGCGQAVPASNRSARMSGETPRVEPRGQQLLRVRLEQLRDSDLGVEHATEPLSCSMTRTAVTSRPATRGRCRAAAPCPC